MLYITALQKEPYNVLIMVNYIITHKTQFYNRVIIVELIQLKNVHTNIWYM